MSTKAADSLSKTPSALTDRLINFMQLNFLFSSLINYLYLEYLRLMLFLRLVSYPTVNSTTYIKYCLSSKSICQDGNHHQLMRADQQKFSEFDRMEDYWAIQLRTESCLQVIDTNTSCNQQRHLVRFQDKSKISIQETK